MLNLWTSADGGEHAEFYRPPPVQRRSPVPLFPEGLPLKKKKRRAPSDRARDKRRRESQPCPSDPASQPPGTYAAAPGPPGTSSPAPGPSGTYAQSPGPTRTNGPAPCPLGVTAPAPGSPGPSSPVPSSPESLSFSSVSPKPGVATPPCSRHVPYTDHLPPSPTPIPQLDGNTLSPKDPTPSQSLTQDSPLVLPPSLSHTPPSPPDISPSPTPSSPSYGDGHPLSPSPAPAPANAPKPVEPDPSPPSTCTPCFNADDTFLVAIDKFMTRELAGDGYRGVEVVVTPVAMAIIISTTMEQKVLGKNLRRIRELESIVEKRFNIPENIMRLSTRDIYSTRPPRLTKVNC